MVQVKEEKKPKKRGRPPKRKIADKPKFDKPLVQDVKLEIVEPEKKDKIVPRETTKEEKPKSTIPPDVALDWSHLTPYKRSV